LASLLLYSVEVRNRTDAICALQGGCVGQSAIGLFFCVCIYPSATPAGRPAPAGQRLARPRLVLKSTAFEEMQALSGKDACGMMVFVYSCQGTNVPMARPALLDMTMPTERKTRLLTARDVGIWNIPGDSRILERSNSSRAAAALRDSAREDFC